MLRLQNKEFDNDERMDISENFLLMNNDIWQNCRQFLNDGFQLIPVRSEKGELIAYGHQDNEANRELRMLKELRNNKAALQFTNVFPEYKEVVIYGCNELAFFFAKYLQELGVAISVIGKYWDSFGYTSKNELNLLGGG